MVADTNVWTPERVRALPDDGKRYEVIDGELLVTPWPRADHQHMITVLFRVLDTYVEAHALGLVLTSPADIGLAERSLVQPDLFVIPAPVPVPLGEWSAIRSLLLAIEVLSPSSARSDRRIKRGYYQRAGVPEYWILDLDARLVERWRPDDERPELQAERLVWHPSASVVPLILDLPALFESVLGHE